MTLTSTISLQKVKSQITETQYKRNIRREARCTQRLVNNNIEHFRSSHIDCDSNNRTVYLK